jgi:hypothetical protein
MRESGINPGANSGLTDEYKRKVVRRSIQIMEAGYSKTKAERIVRHDMNRVERWADALEIPWPKPRKKKEGESLGVGDS